jgi:hypothetical protein
LQGLKDLQPYPVDRKMSDYIYGLMMSAPMAGGRYDSMQRFYAPEIARRLGRQGPLPDALPPEPPTPLVPSLGGFLRSGM